MKWMLILVALMGIGATTRPIDLNTAKSLLSDAKAAAIQKLANIPEYQTAEKEREARRAVLEAARQGGEREEKIAASSAFVKAAEAVRVIELNALANDPAVAAAQEQVDALTRERNEKVAEEDRREKAARKAKLIATAAIDRNNWRTHMEVGMTPEEVDSVVTTAFPSHTDKNGGNDGTGHRIRTQTTAGTVLEWTYSSIMVGATVGGPVSSGGPLCWVTFVDGKAVAFEYP